MNHPLARILLLTTILCSAAPLLAQQTRVSPHETISTILQGDARTGARLMIVYGRPYTKTPRGTEMRKIWGGLVKYDEVWRTGADEATLMITKLPLDIGGTTVPAGAYTLWTLPKADGSAKLIVNKAIGIWGEDYDEKQDFARINLTKAALDKSVDQFTMSIDGKPETGFTLKMAWENLQYSVPVKVQK